MRHGNDRASAFSPSIKEARKRHEARMFPDGKTGRVTSTSVDLDVRADDIQDNQVVIREDLPAAYVSSLLDDGHDIKWSARDAARVDLVLDREAGMVRAKGTAKFLLQYPCVRCLTDVAFDIALTLDLRLVQREKPEEIDDEAGAGVDESGHSISVDADIEDMDVASYVDGVISVGALLREQLFLELPMHPACNSARANRTAPCAFTPPKDENWVDPRWEALAKLRETLPAAPPKKRVATNKSSGSASPSASPKPAVVAVKTGNKQEPANAAKQPAKVAKQAAKVAKQAAKVAKQAAKVAKKPTKVAKQAAKVAKKPTKVAKKPAKVAKKPAKKAKASASKKKAALSKRATPTKKALRK